MLLTDELLFDYQRCQRLSFLNRYGDSRQQDPPKDFLLKLKRDSEDYRQSILAEEPLTSPQYPYGNWVKGAEATVALMREGADRIYQGVLLCQGPQGVTLLSRPNLLIKQSGESVFGDWLYIPMDIRFSKRPKTEHQIAIAFHSYILTQIQQIKPPKACLVSREKGKYFVNLQKYLPLMQEVLENCIEMLEKRAEPEVFIARHPCGLCEWYGSCYAIAQSTDHLSLLPGVTPTRYRQLQQLNLTTLESLANADLSELARYLVEVCNNQHAPEAVASQLILQARSTLTNQALPIPGQLPISSRTLPVSPIELYFDIEAQPEMELDFLLGVLAIDRRSTFNGAQPQQKFYSFLAETPAEEAQIWEEFLDLMWAYPIAPVFHFCDYEVQTLKKLAKRYRTPNHRWRPVLNRFVDVHQLATRSAIVPVENYALKSIARWLGFEWSDSSADGAQCVFWYDRWLATGDRTYLDSILTYNEDDCRATFIVKEWLVKFSHLHSPTP